MSARPVEPVVTAVAGLPPKADTPAKPRGTNGTNAVFRCDIAGCNKTFTRKDHLIRHQANHSSAIFTCPTCSRPFKRLDLLQRHEKRNVCNESTGDTPGSTGNAKTYPTQPRKGKRARSPSSSSDGSESPPSVPLANPKASSSYIPPPSAGLGPVLQLTGFEMFDGWDPDFMPQDDWLPTLSDSMAGPYNEPLSHVDLPWNVLMNRTQESSARGQQLMASAGLAAKLQLAFPNYDFSLSTVTDYLHHYWAYTAPSFPFIHRGTLDLETAPLNLIVLMLITGSVHSSNPQNFSPLVVSIRGMLVQQCGMDAPVSIFQSFALCHIYDTWYGNEETLFVAQCMWSTVVAHSRKKGIGVQGASSGDGEDEVWANWAQGEERRRAAYCVLMLDTQISAFWNQHSSRQLSIFAHDLPLPCPRSQWDATSAGDWVRARAAKSTPTSPSVHTSKRVTRGAYLPGLHPEFRVTQVPDGYSSAILSAMVAQADLQFPVDLENTLAVQMVLLGLMGTAWDQRIKGGMGIKFKEGAKHWRKLTQDALIHLRATWEGATQHVASCAETRDMRDTFGISILSVLSDIPMLLAFAGASTICGSALTPKHYADARKRCRLWVKTDDAFTCLWQSARYLKQALLADWGMYTPWAVFLTTLVLYSYATTAPAIQPIFPRPSTTPADLANVLLDTILGSNARPQLNNEPILDLLLCVADILSTKGTVEQGNATILWRIINDSASANVGASNGIAAVTGANGTTEMKGGRTRVDSGGSGSESHQALSTQATPILSHMQVGRGGVGDVIGNGSVTVAGYGIIGGIGVKPHSGSTSGSRRDSVVNRGSG